MSAREPEKPRFAPWEPPSSRSPAHGAASPSTHPNALARQRTALGFDDIPVAHPGELQREKKFRGWVGKQQITKFIKNKQYLDWKEDLKWALHADKGDEEQIPKKHSTSADTVRKSHIGVIPQSPRPQFGAPPHPSAARQQIASATTAEAASTKTIDINISFGALPKPDFSKPYVSLKKFVVYLWQRWKKLSKKQKLLLNSGLSAALLAVLCLIYVPGIIDIVSNNPHAPNTAGSGDNHPTYATVLPDSKTAANTAWQRVSPPDGNPVYAYADTLDDIVINVSQQPVPDGFQPNIDEKVADLAKSYTATDKISAGSTPIYVGTSSQGPQSVILTKNNLLILIKSANKISDNSWAKYVESLH